MRAEQMMFILAATMYQIIIRLPLNLQLIEFY